MAAYDNFHSRLVGWTKILLPLSALALLSTLFLFARGDDASGTIPIVDINTLATAQGINAPAFSGIANDGSVIQLTANSAKPLDDATLSIDAPRLSVDSSDGTSLVIRSGDGRLNNTDRTAELTNLTRIEASSGYIMETEGMRADLGAGRFTSLGPLEIQSPYGSLTAGQVTIASADSDLGQQMHFTQGVKLIYTPPTDAP